MFIPDYITKKEIEKDLDDEDLKNKMIDILKLIVSFDMAKYNYVLKAIDEIAENENERSFLNYVYDFTEYYNRHLKYRIYLSNVKAEENIQKLYYEAMNEFMRDTEKRSEEKEKIDKKKLN